MIKDFEMLESMLGELSDKPSVAVVWPEDAHTLEAIKMVVDKQLVKPVLLGRKMQIKDIMKTVGINETDVLFKEADSPEDAALLAASMARAGEVACIMKGSLETGKLMKVLVNKDHGVRTDKKMSLLALMDSPNYHKVFGITDVGLLMYPSVEEKKAALENAVYAFNKLGIEKPKVAVLSSVEVINKNMPDSVDAAQLKTWNQEGLIKNCIVEGPISYDLSVDAEAVEIKHYESPVGGDADILVVPDIVSGNILAKALTYTGGAKTCGIVIGALVPLIITSRSATVQDKYMAIILSTLIGRQ